MRHWTGSKPLTVIPMKYLQSCIAYREKHVHPLSMPLLTCRLSAHGSQLTTPWVTNQLSSSPVNLFDLNEGVQQERLGVWLTDNLHPSGVYQSPQIPTGSNSTREMTDLLLTYPHGTIFIESKAVSVISRAELPSREQLKKSTAGHVEKALKQLRGAIRRLKDGTEIMTEAGRALEPERDQPVHAIILVADFDLIEDRSRYGRDFIEEFVSATGCFIHMLDVTELLRVVQAAEIISDRSQEMTAMMAFDYYLIERMKIAIQSDCLCAEVLLRFEDANNQID